MENVGSEIRKQIPRKSSILGYYNEDEERWIKAPNREILTMIGLTIEEITPFVKDAIRQMKRLSGTFNIEKVSFDLDVQGNRIRFTVMLEKEA